MLTGRRLPLPRPRVHDGGPCSPICRQARHRPRRSPRLASAKARPLLRCSATRPLSMRSSAQRRLTAVGRVAPSFRAASRGLRRTDPPPSPARPRRRRSPRSAERRAPPSCGSPPPRRHRVEVLGHEFERQSRLVDDLHGPIFGPDRAIVMAADTHGAQCPSKLTSVRTSTSRSRSFVEPPSSGRSMTKQAPITSAPT